MDESQILPSYGVDVPCYIPRKYLDLIACTIPQTVEEAQVPGEDVHLGGSHPTAQNLLDKVSSGPLWTIPYQLH